MSEGIVYDDTFLPCGVSAPPSSADAVRVGAIEPRSVVAGPGERTVIWVTGCLRRCPGCMKPEWFDFSAGQSISVDDLVDRVIRIHAARPLHGVTFSGGEPFEQAAPLAIVAARLRERAGLNVLAYSGYRLTALRDEPRFAVLLDECDWLIDGAYHRDRPGPLPWRGSDNQAVLKKSDSGTFRPAAENDAPRAREVQVSLTASGLRLSGFPDIALQRDLRASLERRGIRMTEQS